MQNSLCNNFQGYLGIFNHTHRSVTRGREDASPAISEFEKKCPDFGKKDPDRLPLWVKFTIQNVVLRVCITKPSEMVLCGNSFSCIF